MQPPIQLTRQPVKLGSQQYTEQHDGATSAVASVALRTATLEADLSSAQKQVQELQAAKKDAEAAAAQAAERSAKLEAELQAAQKGAESTPAAPAEGARSITPEEAAAEAATASAAPKVTKTPTLSIEE